MGAGVEDLAFSLYICILFSVKQHPSILLGQEFLIHFVLKCGCWVLLILRKVHFFFFSLSLPAMSVCLFEISYDSIVGRQTFAKKKKKKNPVALYLG